VSVWDDSWGHTRISVTLSDKPQVTGGMMVDSGTGQCDNTDPLLTTITRTTEEVAGMTPAYRGTPTPARPGSVPRTSDETPAVTA
jgi:hypothetical protein